MPGILAKIHLIDLMYIQGFVFHNTHSFYLNYFWHLILDFLFQLHFAFVHIVVVVVAHKADFLNQKSFLSFIKLVSSTFTCPVIIWRIAQMILTALQKLCLAWACATCESPSFCSKTDEMIYLLDQIFRSQKLFTLVSVAV